MKIAIDISQVIYGTGVSVYTRALVRNLLKIDKENEYILFGGSLRRRQELKEFLNTLKVTVPKRSPTRSGSNFKGKVFPIPPALADIVWNRLHILPIERLVGHTDVFHSSDWVQPPTKSFTVTTVHDLVTLKFPKISHPKIVAAHKKRLRWVEKEVDRVIVPSKATKKDLLSLGLEEERIRVIPEAPDSIFKPAKKSEIEKLKKKYKLGEKYLLAIGVNPRKNTKRIIAAFEKVRAGKNLKLAIIGEMMIEIEPTRGVIFLGHIPQDELPALYSGTEALVYPSLYEGFGLPILEAFACKTPVVTSNFGSLKEVGGDAVVYVVPYKVSEIVEGIREALSAKKALIERGSQRVKEFSWEKTAQATLKVYEESERKR